MTSLKTCLTAKSYLLKTFTLLVVSSVIPLNTVLAGTVKKAYVDYDGDEYHLNLIMQIKAPVKKVWPLLTNYSQLKKVNDSVTHSQVLKAQKNITRIKVTSEGCVIFFCRTVTQVQDIRDLGQGYLVISEVSGQSDFTSGHTLWHVVPHQQGTQVTIRARLKPGFWIPPFIGPWLFQKKLLGQGETVINNLEKLTAP